MNNQRKLQTYKNVKKSLKSWSQKEEEFKACFDEQ